MRPVLLRFFLDEPWAFWKVDQASGVGGPGVALVLTALLLTYVVWSYLAFREILPDDRPILGGAVEQENYYRKADLLPPRLRSVSPGGVAPLQKGAILIIPKKLLQPAAPAVTTKT